MYYKSIEKTPIRRDICAVKATCKIYKKPHKNSKKVVVFVLTQKCMK